MSHQKTRSRSGSQTPQLGKKIRKLSSKESDSSSTERRCNRLWTQEEDKLLIEAQSRFGNNWRLIAAEFDGRSPQQCAQRWKRINPQKTKSRKQWSEEEDRQVVRLVDVHGKNWKLIEELMQGRTGKQIRERFLNNLDPDINNEKFSEEEDLLILKQYRIFGPKWSEISKALQRRPENQVKNRFYSYIKRIYLLKDKSDSSSEEESDESQQNKPEKIEIEQKYNPLDTIHSVQENNSVVGRTPSARLPPFIGFAQQNDSFDSYQQDISPFNQKKACQKRFSMSYIQAESLAYQQTPQNRLQPASIHFIQDSFEQEQEQSPSNQKKILDYSPINCENLPQSPNFDIIAEDIKDLNNQIESMYLNY